MADSLRIDFETRSTADLPDVGVYRYAEDPNTDIWCMAYAFDDEEPMLWVPPWVARIIGVKPPGVYRRLREHIEGGGEIRAWNAAFERTIWREILAPRYGFPLPQMEQYVDTAAEGAAMALPRALGKAAAVLGLKVEKDMAGNGLAKRMAKPRKPRKGEDSDALLWWDDPERIWTLLNYCKQDVRVEGAVAKHTRRLSPSERKVYLLDQTINDRGIRLDLPLVKAALDLSKTGAKRAGKLLSSATDGVVKSVTDVNGMKKFCGLDSLAKDIVRDILDGTTAADLSDTQREVLQIRQDYGKSSAKKLVRMLAVVMADERVRGLLLYHGAGTGRWSGKLIQPQNFPRPTIDDIEHFVALVLARDYDAIEAEDRVLHVLSSLLRSMLVPSPGCVFMGADFSQIEARVLAWIAGQDDLVEAFATGGKIYERMAAHIYGVPVEEITKDDPRRQTGKATVLGAGFQMGPETFATQAMVRDGVYVSPELAGASIKAYREMNHQIVNFWYAIERAAKEAVRRPGTTTYVGRGGAIRYLCKGKWLWCRLPSGRLLAYNSPKIRPRVTPWGEEKQGLQFMGTSSKTKQWSVQHAYGGFLTENVVQAMARDLIASSMLRVEKHGYPVVLTVHDEAVSDVPIGHGCLEEYEALMKVRPRWAAGIPVDAEAWQGDRYQK